MWIISTDAEKPTDAQSARYNTIIGVKIVCEDYRKSAEFIESINKKGAKIVTNNFDGQGVRIYES